MAIDFNKISSSESAESATNPRDVFKLLPDKNPKYNYLRDVQAEVLDSWEAQKERETNIIKMNTGAGKTLVGLLILKACQNENRGPAVYVAPDNFLLNQAIDEAENLGIEITTDPNSIRFKRCKAILLINVHKLFNGKSVFGVGDDGIKIDIGTILIDDAHACIEKIEEQFTLSISRSNESYLDIFNIFKQDLQIQSQSIIADIEDYTPYASILVPFWVLQAKYKSLFEILHEIRNQDELKFNLPLMINHLHLTDCVISSEKIEFSIRILPIHIINSFVSAKRKIIMSATLPDDSTLHSHLGISTNDIEKAITPKSASDLGERLILVPQELNERIKFSEIKQMVIEFSTSINVVVIVPSTQRAETNWNDIAYKTAYAHNIDDVVQELKSKHCGLVVLVNKYDGIDLPQDCCRLLVIDELPDARREIDKIDQTIINNKTTILKKKIQKIEQGMGRGIRSNEDYCAVLLVGSSLVNHLYTNNAIDFFTPATKAQFDLSDQISEQIREQGISSIKETIDLLIMRDKNWVKANKQALVHTSYAKSTVSTISKCLRSAFQDAEVRKYSDSASKIQSVVNSLEDPIIRGWLRYYLGMMINFSNPVESQLIIQKAIEENRRLPIPIEGVSYIRLAPSNIEQAERCLQYLKSHHENKNNLILNVKAILDDLVFSPDTSNRFEQAIKDIAFYLGYSAQRPENEFKKGPDNLWSLGQLDYLVIECKNGCETDYIKKHDCNQLNGSINWFENEYDQDCNATPILIHPSNRFHRSCSPHRDIKIITIEELSEFKRNVDSFILAVSEDYHELDFEKVGKLLKHYHLTAKEFKDKYLIDYIVNE